MTFPFTDASIYLGVGEFLSNAFSMPFDDHDGFNDDQRVAPILPES